MENINKAKIDSLKRLYSKHLLKRDILLDNIERMSKEIEEIDKYCEEINIRLLFKTKTGGE